MKKKLNLLQIFRGVAAMLVVFYHLGRTIPGHFKNEALLGNFFSFGYLGVDFFFVLSGFIITYVHYFDLMNGSNKVIFVKKRLIRIFPIYWIIATASLILLIFVFKGDTSHMDHHMDFSSLSEWRYILGCYLLIPMKYKFFVGVAWTLSYELFFYILFFICISLKYERAKYLIAVWFGLTLLKVVLSSYYTLPSPIIFNAQIIEFLAGCLVAYLIRNSHLLRESILLPLIVLTFCIELYVFNKVGYNSLNVILLAVLNGLIIYEIVIIDLYKNFKSSAIMLLIGEASYSIYLSHWLLLGFLSRIFSVIVKKMHLHNYFIMQMVFIIIGLITITAGFICYKFIEKPVIIYLNKVFLKKEKLVRA